MTNLVQNFISPATVREITSLRHDFLSSLSDLGFIPRSATATSRELNANSKNTNIIKAVILGGLWPRVAQVHLPRSAIKCDQVQAGTVQRENTAKEYKIHDLTGVRVFLHPSSVLFGESTWKLPFLAYFQKQMTTKVFIRGATQVRGSLDLTIFGGCWAKWRLGSDVCIAPLRWTCVRQPHRGWSHSWKGWQCHQIESMAPHRNSGKPSQVICPCRPHFKHIDDKNRRRLFDAQLQQCIEDGSMLGASQHNAVANAMSALLANDGLSG